MLKQRYVRRVFFLVLLALSVAIGISCPKAGHLHQSARVSTLPASAPVQTVIPAGSPTDCLGRFNPFESFADPDGFGKFLNNCFRPDSYVRGFGDGIGIVLLIPLYSAAGAYHDGSKHSYSRHWFESGGKLLSEQLHEYSIKTKEVIWSSDGNIISKWEISEGDPIVQSTANVAKELPSSPTRSAVTGVIVPRKNSWFLGERQIGQRRCKVVAQRRVWPGE